MAARLCFEEWGWLGRGREDRRDIGGGRVVGIEEREAERESIK